MLKISVILPIYNVEKYLNECLDSILKQSYKNLEIILVDDGSTDTSPLICDEYANEDSRIVVIHKSNGGLSDARNCGLELSTGDYVFFVDSDDCLIDDNAINCLVEVVNNYHDIDLVIFNSITYYDVSKKIINSKPFDLLKINGKDKMEVLKYLIYSGKYSPSAWAKLIKRKVLIENRIYFEKGLIAEDIDWCFRLMLYIKSIYAINDSFYQYRVRKGSISGSKKPKNAFDLLYIIKKWTKKLRTTDSIPEEFRELFLGYCAFEYAILMAGLFQYNYSVRKKLIKEMFPLRYLLQCNINYKTNMVLKVYRFCGFYITCIVLRFYVILRSIGYRF